MFPEKSSIRLEDIDIKKLVNSLDYLKKVPSSYPKGSSIEEDDEEDVYFDIGLQELFMLGIPMNKEVYKDGINKILGSDLDSLAKMGYKVRVVNVPQNIKLDYDSKEIAELGYKIYRCKVCWDPLKDKETVLGHLLDAQLGGSYIMFVEKDDDPHVFNRFFKLEGQDGKQELFWDTIEGRNTGRFSIRDWDDDGVLHELALSIAGFIAVGKEIGAVRAYFSEFEIEEFLKGLMENVPKNEIKRSIGTKVGIQPDSPGPKPFFYRYVPGSKKYYLDLTK